MYFFQGSELLVVQQAPLAPGVQVWAIAQLTRWHQRQSLLLQASLQRGVWQSPGLSTKSSSSAAWSFWHSWPSPSLSPLGGPMVGGSEAGTEKNAPTMRMWQSLKTFSAFCRQPLIQMSSAVNSSCSTSTRSNPCQRHSALCSCNDRSSKLQFVPVWLRAFHLAVLE